MTDDPAAVPLPENLDSALLRVLMDALPDTIYFKDRQSRFVRINRAQAALLGLERPEDAIGKSDFDFFVRSHAEIAFAEEQEILRTGRPLLTKEEKITLRDGREAWVSASKLPWRDAGGAIIGTFGLSRDITAAKRAEERLASERNLLRTIIDHLPSRIFVKDAAGRYLINNLAHQRSLGIARQEDSIGRGVLDFHPGERGRQAEADDRQVLSGGPPIIDQEKSDFGPSSQTRWALTTKVPLRDAMGRITGLVGISHDITERKRTEAELRRRTEEMEADLRMACQIQQAFFPRDYPSFPPGVPVAASLLRFAHRYQPAATLGGDFFDVLRVSDSAAGVLICDVMGHGVRAGLVTALLRGLVEELHEVAAAPDRMLAEINRGLAPILQQTGLPVFASVFYGVVDAATAELRFANAGHPPPCVLRRDAGRVEALDSADPEPAAGLDFGFAYTLRRAPFAPGDGLFLFSDGLFEAADPGGQAFGADRLRQLLAEHLGLRGDALVERVVTAVRGFTGRADFDDDLCAVLIDRS